MNIELVRKLDYYIGVPLCFLGTMLKYLGRMFGSGRHPERPANVLFIELSEMGSVILADPAMMKLKHSANASIYFAIFRKNRASLEFLNTVPPGNIFLMGDTGLLAVAMGAIRLLFWTRAKGIDTVIDLELFSRFTALLTGFSGAGRTVGFHGFYNEGLYRGNFLTHKVAYNPHQHIAKNFISMVNALLADSVEVPYSKSLIRDEEIVLRTVEVSVEERQAMLRKIGMICPCFSPERHKVILFNTNSSDLIPLRRWPQDNYIRLARMILEGYPDTVILLTGSPVERADKENIIKAVGSERCVNFAGETSISELVALYTVSLFMLTNDSGPAHFASVTDMPVFVLFGPETPAIYGPLGRMTPIYAGLACSPCVSAINHRKSACSDNICLQVITPGQVMNMLRQHLEGGRQP
ncbi:MAG: glycosyltransferase family 9 protein [Desulfuromonadales bacterium]